jgi:outer membrane protein OmpA-like peptidoglycan-associated protein
MTLLVSWGLFWGCSSFLDDLRETIAQGNLDRAILEGEKHLLTEDANVTEERADIERVVAEAYLLRARRSDSVDTYRGIRARLSKFPDLQARVIELEARAHFRDVVAIEASVDATRNHRNIYPDSPHTFDSRKLEIQIAFREAIARDTVDAYKSFREEYREWTEFDQELGAAFEREGERALDDAVAADRIEHIRAVRRAYVKVRPRAEREELKLAFKKLFSGNAEMPCENFMLEYQGFEQLSTVAAALENEVWSFAESQNAPCIWRIFYRSLPDSPRAEAARFAEKEASWRLAESDGTAEAYRAFVEAFPDDPRAPGAEAKSFRLEKIERLHQSFPRAALQDVTDLGDGIIEAVFKVVDCEGRQIGGVHRSQIEVYDGGEPAEVVDFIGFEEDRELDLHIALDQSGSMSTEQDAVRLAIVEFASVLALRGRNTRFSLVPFSDTVQSVFGPTTNPATFASWILNLKSKTGDRGMEDGAFALSRIAALTRSKSAERVTVFMSDEDLQIGNAGFAALQVSAAAECESLLSSVRCMDACRSRECVVNCTNLSPILREVVDECRARADGIDCALRRLESVLGRLTSTCVTMRKSNFNLQIQPVQPHGTIFNRLVETIRQSRIRVFGVTPLPLVGHQELARSTGGRHVEVPDNVPAPEPYVAALMEIAEDLSRQYIVRFRLPEGRLTPESLGILVRTAHQWNPQLALPAGGARVLLGGISSEACPPLRLLMNDNSVWMSNDCGRNWRPHLAPAGDTVWVDAVWSGSEDDPIFLQGRLGELGRLSTKVQSIEPVKLDGERVISIAWSGERFIALTQSANGAAHLRLEGRGVMAERFEIPGGTVETSDAIITHWNDEASGAICVLDRGQELRCRNIANGAWTVERVEGLQAGSGGPGARIVVSSLRPNVALLLDRHGQVYRTINGGKRWSRSREWPSSPVGPTRLLELRGTLPAFCVFRSGELECSEDDGRTWNAVGRRRDAKALTADIVGDGRNLFIASDGYLQELQEVRDRELPSATVLFDSGVDMPRASTERFFRVMASGLVEEPPSAVIIEGHTDQHGSDATNEELAYRRAENIASLLARLGVPRSSMVVKSYGERFPIRSGGTPADDARNRRVELIILRDLPESGWGPRPCQGTEYMP